MHLSRCKQNEDKQLHAKRKLFMPYLCIAINCLRADKRATLGEGGLRDYASSLIIIMQQRIMNMSRLCNNAVRPLYTAFVAHVCLSTSLGHHAGKLCTIVFNDTLLTTFCTDPYHTRGRQDTRGQTQVTTQTCVSRLFSMRYVH